MQADRSLRSVFVGNIPYDATEEKLRDIFSAVGPVLSFRIVFDRETGKPKGYGFCEYKDQETATSAIRNLNGHDLGGRQLRVDSASNEKARDEPDSAPVNSHPENHMQQNPIQHQAGPPIAEPLVDAQHLINNVLIGLPPEQLFQICKQLKASLLTNPNETRQLLIQNPQLTYAVLQSLVMIKAIDAPTAMNTLHKQLMQPAPLQSNIPMMAAMGQGLPGAGMVGPLGATGPASMVMQAPALTSAGPIVMQPQLLNPYAFMSPNPLPNPTSTAQPPQTAPLQPVSIQPVVPSAPSGAPADPRLARQQQHPPQPQQQQLPQQSQNQQSNSVMTDQERQAFLMQVVNMSDQEISLLPAEQQDKIYILRRQYMANFAQ